MPQTVLTRKDQLSESRIYDWTTPELDDGEVLLRAESFAVTANNVTYAVIGDMFGYWNFFPAADGVGVVPVWGHAVVEASRFADLIVGERVYGYLPMATHLVVQPGKIHAAGFTDMAAHRQPMAAIYNQYSRLAADPEHDSTREDARMIFGPLFKTGFLIADMFNREAWFGADTLVMTSASSKTALALAHCAKAASPQIRRIGLTSAGNIAFVRETGLFDDVLPYDDIGTLAQTRTVGVDFAGNAAVGRSIHTHLADNLAYSCLVGATHVESRGGSSEPMPGPAPILFFAPDHAAATVKAIGPQAFAEAVAANWQSFVVATDRFMTVSRRDGLIAAMDAFQSILTGAASPDTGIVINP